MLGIFRLDAESRRGCLLLNRPGWHHDAHAVSVAPVNLSGLSSQKPVDNRVSSPGHQLKPQCQVHGGQIDEHTKVGGIGIVIWEKLSIASLESPNVSFTETMLFEVIPEDFKWDHWAQNTGSSIYVR
jgi:hypothetical protein